MKQISAAVVLLLTLYGLSTKATPKAEHIEPAETETHFVSAPFGYENPFVIETTPVKIEVDEVEQSLPLDSPAAEDCCEECECEERLQSIERRLAVLEAKGTTTAAVGAGSSGGSITGGVVYSSAPLHVASPPVVSSPVVSSSVVYESPVVTSYNVPTYSSRPVYTQQAPQVQRQVTRPVLFPRLTGRCYTDANGNVRCNQRTRTIWR